MRRSNRKRTPAVYYDEILTAIQLLHQYRAGLSFADFESNVQMKDAILHRLQILTEAARRLTPEDLELCPGPDWKSIRDLGNVIRHDYDGIDLSIIWHILEDKLPPLKAAVEQTMREHFPEIPLL